MDRDILIQYVNILNKIESIPYDVRIGNNDLDSSLIHFVEEKAYDNQELSELLKEIKSLSPSERVAHVKQYFNEQDANKNISDSSSEEDQISNTFGVDVKDIQHLFLENGHEIFVFYYSEWNRNVVLENSKEGQSLSEQMKSIQEENEKYQSEDDELNAKNIMSEEFVKGNMELEFYTRDELENHSSLIESLGDEDKEKLRYLLKHYSELDIQGINITNMIYMDQDGEIHEATLDEEKHVYITKPAGTDYSTEEEEVSNSDELGAMLDDDSEELEEELEKREGLEKPKVYTKKDNPNNFGFTNNAVYLFLALLVVLIIVAIVILVF